MTTLLQLNVHDTIGTHGREMRVCDIKKFGLNLVTSLISNGFFVTYYNRENFIKLPSLTCGAHQNIKRRPRSLAQCDNT